VIAIHLENQVVENGVIGKQEKLMANFAHQILIRFGFALAVSAWPHV
jgi:hypothetical protein